MEEEAEERVLLAAAPKWPASRRRFDRVEHTSFLFFLHPFAPLTEFRGKPLFPLSISREKRGETRQLATRSLDAFASTC